jgi:TonB-linked SusC/RagA family outer membrane protein
MCCSCLNFNLLNMRSKPVHHSRLYPEKPFFLTVLFAFLFMVTPVLASNGQLLKKVITSISIPQGNLMQAISTLEKHSGMKFSYDENYMQRYEVKSAKWDKATIEKILTQLVASTNLEFEEKFNTIIIYPGTSPKPSSILQSSQRTVKGKVMEGTDPIPGATVRIKETNAAVVTDEQGTFTIKVPTEGKYTMLITAIGYKRAELKITSADEYTVQLESLASELKQVVVVGYGTQRKKDLTGSVVSIKAEDLEKSNPITLEQGIQGKAAGVFVTQTDGAPGAGMSVQIRGTNSFMGGTEPLYVIDGVPMTEDNASITPGSGSTFEQQKVNMLSFLNPGEIESIEILKDASATAIYGSRGANGVVMITTKKGIKGQDKIDFRLVTSVSQLSKKYKLLNAEQFAEYQNETYLNSDKYLGTTYEADDQLPYPGRYDNLLKKYLPAPKDFRGGGTDWQDEIYSLAPLQDYNLSFSGGTDNNTYLISGNLIDQRGIINNSRFKRYSLRVNLNRKVKDWLQIGTNITYSRTTNNLVTTGASIVGPEGGVVKSALTFLPTVPMMDTASGEFTQLYFTSNPYQYTQQALNQVTNTQLLTSTFAEITFTPNLKLRSVLGWNVSNGKRDQYFPQTINEGNAAKGRAYAADNDGQSLSSENYFTYNKLIGRHSINGTLGLSYGQGVYQWKQIGASGFMNDALQNNSLQSATIIDRPASGKSDWKMLSYFGRVNYVFNDKYLFTATYRRDGSSKFAANNKWAGFASGAVAWRISEEALLKQVKWLSNLKARASYGQSGNQGIGSYASLSQISASNYPYNGTLNNGYVVSSLGNDNLRWETTNQIDLGLDIGLWEERLTFVLDYYSKKTKDLLQNVTLPTSTGFRSQLRNIGKVANEGYEAAVSASIIDNRNFRWNASANISFNKNKILDLGDVTEQWVQQIGTEPVNYQPFIQIVGKPIGIIYGFKEDGIFQTEAEVTSSKFFDGQPAEAIKRQVGEVRYVDKDGNHVIDANDRMIIGDINPDFYYGFSNNFSYKGFDLSVFFQGVQGGKIINTLKYITDNQGSYSNTTEEAYNNRWTGPGSNATNPKAVLNSFRLLRFSDRFVEDGSYLRLKNINLGYTFDLTNNRIIKALRVYTSINNLLTITKYSGYDPEVNGFGQDPSRRGVDLGNYPNSKTYSIGVNCTF